MKKFLLLLFTVYSLLFTFTLANPSPVVQVISYKEPLGMYFSLQWWGSGSIIDSSGHVLTNNHVVDNGFGVISDNFSLCVTEDPTLPPQCHYTASVISRDVAKDIALLKIDPTDIFGRIVNYSSLNVLPLDYDYLPRSGDGVTALGYPWVGANTITETQWIVSGTYSYNGNTYIKTDTLIAGGNSGGPLVREGKIVWVNTFLIGGFFDPALGYSLSISEAQDFIKNTINDAPLQNNSPQFAPFLRSIYEATKQQKLSDPLVTMTFPEKYTITTHIPGSYIDGQISEESSTAVYSFSFLHFNTPKLTTPEEIRYFLSSQSFFPFWQDIKFKAITIGGQAFYEVDTLGNTGGDKTKTEYVYFKIVDNSHLLLLQLSTPFSNESTYDIIQNNITQFLRGVSFPKTFSFPTIDTLEVRDAWILTHPSPESLIDFRSNFFPYNGVISQLMATADDLFSERTYLSSLWSYAQLSIVPNSFYTEDTTAAELLSKLRESPYFSENTDSNLITYKGHEWFITCDNSSWSQVTDEKNTSHLTATCEVILLVGEDDSHFLSLIYLTDKRKKSEIVTLMRKFLDENTTFPWDGETNFGENSAQFFYTDVDNQSTEFQETLKHLLKYGILSPRPVFDWDHALTWEEYVRLYVWMIYHRRLTDTIVPWDPQSPSFESILKKLPIDMKAYVDSTQRNTFDLMFRMNLAGVNFTDYTEKSLDQFEIQKDTTYHLEWQKIEDFEYAYFMGKKMSPNGSTYYNAGYYNPQVSLTYNPVTGLSSEPVLGTDPIRFWVYSLSEKIRLSLEEELQCTKTSAQYFSRRCFQLRQEYLWSAMNYSVLTKGDAINHLVSWIDFALWDEALAKKKLVQVEQENT